MSVDTVAALLGLGLALAIIVGMLAFQGWLASLVLAYFGVHAPWHICAIALLVLSGLFGAGKAVASQ